MFQHKHFTLSFLLLVNLPSFAASTSHSADLLQNKEPYYFVSDSLTFNNKAHITYDKLNNIVHSHGDKLDQRTHIVVMPTVIRHS